MKAILSSWNLFRWVRLLAGVGFVTYGAIIIDWPFIIIGIMLSWMAISNTGCSPFSQSCEIEPKVKSNNEGILEDNN